MKIEITVVPYGKSEQMFPCSFDLNDKKVILVDASTVMYGSVTPRKGEENPKEMSLTFDRSNQTHKIFYETDDSGKPVTGHDRSKKEVIENFFMKHPLCTINGKVHPGTRMAMFDVIDEQIAVASRLEEWDIKRRVANFLSEADLTQLRDICYYYGRSPIGKTKGQICLEMADYTEGELFKRENDQADYNYRGFVLNWIDGEDPDREFVINCRKAISLRIVTEVPKGGNISYYLGTQFIGVSFMDVVGFFKKEERLYNEYVIRGIRERDHFAEETAKTKAENKVLSARSGSKDEINQLRNEVLGMYDDVYKIAGSQTRYNIESLKKYGPTKLKEALDGLTKQYKELTEN